jgi:hypothetical protein
MIVQIDRSAFSQFTSVTLDLPQSPSISHNLCILTSNCIFLHNHVYLDLYLCIWTSICGFINHHFLSLKIKRQYSSNNHPFWLLSTSYDLLLLLSLTFINHLPLSIVIGHTSRTLQLSSSDPSPPHSISWLYLIINVRYSSFFFYRMHIYPHFLLDFHLVKLIWVPFQ